MKKRVWGVIMVMLLMLVTTACSSQSDSSSNSATSADPEVSKDEREAQKAIDRFDECSAFNGQFVLAEYGNITKTKATLMHNDSEDSYKFSLTLSGQSSPLVTFYLAKIEVPKADRYFYVFVSTQAHGYFYKEIKDDNEIVGIGDGFDTGKITLSDIEDNFEMSNSKEFTLHA
ncbi:hypothetical protein [Companilactobacillus tucceti]|nr:hypothetical protein [Companilactobacillus tucceti]